jgi:hypothetical protein
MSTIPGTLLHHETIPTNVPGARAWRVRYASSDVNGKATESTGLVIARPFQQSSVHDDREANMHAL